jgi:hypothetical protein
MIFGITWIYTLLFKEIDDLLGLHVLFKEMNDLFESSIIATLYNQTIILCYNLMFGLLRFRICKLGLLMLRYRYRY